MPHTDYPTSDHISEEKLRYPLVTPDFINSTRTRKLKPTLSVIFCAAALQDSGNYLLAGVRPEGALKHSCVMAVSPHHCSSLRRYVVLAERTEDWYDLSVTPGQRCRLKWASSEWPHSWHCWWMQARKKHDQHMFAGRQSGAAHAHTGRVCERMARWDASTEVMCWIPPFIKSHQNYISEVISRYRIWRTCFHQLSPVWLCPD